MQPDTLMGWQSSADTKRQVRMRFPNRETAIAYAEAHHIAFDLAEPKHAALSQEHMPIISHIHAVVLGRIRNRIPP